MQQERQVFLTEINQELKIGPSFQIPPGRYHVISSICEKKKQGAKILAHVILKDNKITLIQPLM